MHDSCVLIPYIDYTTEIIYCFPNKEKNISKLLFQILQLTFIHFVLVTDTTPFAPSNVSVVTTLFDATIRWIPEYSSTQQYFIIG